MIVRPFDNLKAKVEFFGWKVEARHLQRVLMSWFTNKALPDICGDYLEVQRL